MLRIRGKGNPRREPVINLAIYHSRWSGPEGRTPGTPENKREGKKSNDYVPQSSAVYDRDEFILEGALDIYATKSTT